jgi:uncharacterized protein YidB (DUF937 family)
MSLLDSLGSLVGGSKSGPAALLPVLLEQLKKYPGGLAGLVDSFRKGGLGEIVASWIGKGNNLPVSIDQLRNVLPASLVGSLAQESGQDDNTCAEPVEHAFAGSGRQGDARGRSEGRPGL